VTAPAARLSQLWGRTVASRRSLILCYHGVASSNVHVDPGFLRVKPDVFRAQLELLSRSGFEFLTVAEFAEQAAGRRPRPGMVALSFDDGMDDNHAVVLPILRHYGIRATVYVATGLIGRRNPWMAGDSGARMMTLDELRELVAAGFEIGAHTVSHPDLSRLEFEKCLYEVGESRRVLEEELGISVRTFAYPFCRYGPEAMEAVRSAGFTAAVTCEGLGSWSPYELPRTLVTGKDGMPSYLLKLTGLHQPIFSSPPGRLVRAATRGFRTRRRARRDAIAQADGE
jgi:peptidoglycan/xylan/chitin deacetylase (PgdA/CDA1 family)